MALELVNVRPVVAKCKPDLTPDITALPFSDKTRLVVLVNPSNPTGYVWPQDLVMELQRMCAERNVWLVSDEAYEEFLWDGAKHYSPVGDNVLSLYTLSKGFGMHGWRIGYCAYPPSLRPALQKIQDTLIINACQFSQALATECLRSHSDYPTTQRATLADNRALVWDVVSAYPGTVKTPGAFYFFVKVRVIWCRAELVAAASGWGSFRRGGVPLPREAAQSVGNCGREYAHYFMGGPWLTE